MKIAIVGGGFAGMYAAMRLSGHDGMDITVFDAKVRPGWPANTTGGIATHWIDRYLPGMPDECISARINSVKLVGPGGGAAILSATNPFLANRMGVVLDEPRTIEWLEKTAKSYGADVRRPVRIMDERQLGGFDNIILADGWASKLGTGLGMTPPLHEHDQHQGFEYVIPAQRQDPSQIEIYLGQKVAAAGYVWDFPAEMGKVRRFGIGIPLSENRKRSALSYLKEFADAHGIDISSPIAKEGGVIPTGPASRSIHRGKYYAIGDAAHWTDPLTGGGVFSALASADAVVRHLTDPHSDRIDLDWLYREMRLRYRLKYILINLPDRSLDRLVRRMNITFNGDVLNPITERKRLLPKIIIPLLPDIMISRLRRRYHAG